MVFAKTWKFLYCVFVGTFGLEKEFCGVLDKKTKLAFLDPKNTDLKKCQNLHFSKGVSPWF